MKHLQLAVDLQPEAGISFGDGLYVLLHSHPLTPRLSSKFHKGDTSMFLVLIHSTAMLDPGRAEASFHGPLFGEEAWDSQFDLGLENLMI